MTPEEALADYLDSKFTVAAYKTHRRNLAAKGISLLPYSDIKMAIDSCVPKFDVDEKGASVNLQD